MHAKTLFRIGGWALIVGAIINATDYIFRPATNDPLVIYANPQFGVEAIQFIGSLLFLLSLPAMYAYQAERAGKFGLISFVICFLGYASLEIGSKPMFGLIFPLLANNPATQSLIAHGGEFENYSPFLMYYLPSLVTVNLGFLLFGIATLRARVYPLTTGILMISGVVGVFIYEPLGMFLMSAGFIMCGLILTGRLNFSSKNIVAASQSG